MSSLGWAGAVRGHRGQAVGMKCVFGLTPPVGSELPHTPPALCSTGFYPLPGAQAGGLVLLSPSHSSGCSQSLQGLLSPQLLMF